jgi:lipopolysaccharide/colanic/teichoic acid biosynthesis glycosyltransferase
MLQVHLGDDLILGDLEKKTVTAKGGRLVNLILALVFLVLTLPLWIVLLFYHLFFPSKKFFLSEKRVRYGRMSLDGEMVPQTFNLFLFNSPHRLIAKIPGLINVIRGDLNLVGISALDEEEFRRLPEEWREVRVNAPLGLFHLWELEGRGDLEWEEKMVMECYYAATHSVWWDMKIFGRALFTTVPS